jgi:hypothetical protein
VAGAERFRAVVANKAIGTNNDMPFTRLGQRFDGDRGGET